MVDWLALRIEGNQMFLIFWATVILTCLMGSSQVLEHLTRKKGSKINSYYWFSSILYFFFIAGLMAGVFSCNRIIRENVFLTVNGAFGEDYLNYTKNNQTLTDILYVNTGLYKNYNMDITLSIMVFIFFTLLYLSKIGYVDSLLEYIFNRNVSNNTEHIEDRDIHFSNARKYIETLLHPYYVAAWTLFFVIIILVYFLAPVAFQDIVSGIVAGIFGIALGFVITDAKAIDDKMKEQKEHERRLFLGLYIELKHIHSNIEHIPAMKADDFPSIPRILMSSYDFIRSTGLFNPENEAHVKIEYVYRLLSHIDDQLVTARSLLFLEKNRESNIFVRICKDNIVKVLENLEAVFSSLEEKYDISPEKLDTLKDDWSKVRPV